LNYPSGEVTAVGLVVRTTSQCKLTKLNEIPVVAPLVAVATGSPDNPSKNLLVTVPVLEVSIVQLGESPPPP